MGLGPLRLLSRPGAGDESGGGAREGAGRDWGQGGVPSLAGGSCGAGRALLRQEPPDFGLGSNLPEVT